MSDQPVYLLGAGGHGRVVLDALLAAGVRVLGILDPGLTAGSLLNSVPVLGADAQLDRLDPASARLAIGVGANPATARRAEMFAVATKRGWAMATVRHPSVIAAADCAFADGCQLMAGAVIQCGTRIGANAVINTAASIDHDCSIGEHAFVSPGATLCGDVHLGEGAFIGAGATVLPGVRIGKGAVVGAGAVVLKDVPEKTTVVGNAARKQERSSRE